MPRRTMRTMRRMTLLLVALAACGGQPVATAPTPSPTPTTSVLGVTYGSAAIAEITSVQACTLLSVGEIERAAGTSAGVPVAPGTSESLPSCLWTVSDVENALTLTIATAADYERTALGLEEPDVGDEAQWIWGEQDDAGELRVLITARDRSFTLVFGTGAVFDPRGAARALALHIVPRV